MHIDSCQGILEEKKNIRKNVRAARRKISDEILKKNNTLIEQNLYTTTEYAEAKILHIYISSFNSEVNTFPIIDSFLKNKGKVIVPIVNKEKEILFHSELKTLNGLEKNKFKIWEPVEKYFIGADIADLIIIPGVAYDKKGNRIGHGKGYYDKFLSNVNTPKFALAYDFQIVDDIPVTNNDIPVDVIISEKTIFRT